MRFGIQKKLLLLIALLSLALIVSSVLISSRFYASSMEKNVMDLCSETADSLAETIDAPEYSDFMTDYKSKVEKAYLDNREELEAASEAEFESYDKREEFYDRFTAGIFPPKSGLGLSYEALMFKVNYENLLNDMDMLSFAGGLDISSVFFYDQAHGNIVYLIDRQPEGSSLYNFPVSVRKPWNKSLGSALESGSEASFIADTESYAVKPLSCAEDVFVLFAKNNSDLKQNVRLFTLYVSGILLGATLLIGMFTLLFARKLIVKSIKKLTDASERFTSEIGGGTPEKVSASINSHDEIGDLSQKFDLMQDSILGYISSLAEKTASEEKMKAELDLAARIQSESLPKGGLKTGKAVIESFLKPAREVGGDLYDYFMLDESRMFFCLADVSGKGVPASLFMMRAKELIRAHVMADDTLGEFAFRLNNDLCSGNQESIFITAFFGVLDTVSGRLSYLRAGHEQPFLKRDGRVTKLGEESNFVLGVFEDAEFTADETVLKSGDALLMYTDGLNEGINEANEAFGYERIAETLKSTGKDVTGELYSALLEFCGSAEQFDDVTMLVVCFDGTKRIELTDPDYSDITLVTDTVLNELSGFDHDRASEVGLMIDEIMNNQISYAFENTDHPKLNVEFEICGDDAVLTFEDNGAPFDPLSDVTDDAIELSEGGFGLQLVKALSDEQRYERTACANRLTVRKTMRE